MHLNKLEMISLATTHYSSPRTKSFSIYPDFWGRRGVSLHWILCYYTVASTKLASSVMSICTEVTAPHIYLLYALNRGVSLATVLHVVTSSAHTSLLLCASGTPPVGSTIIGSNFPVSSWIHVNFYFHNILWWEDPQAFHFYDNLSFCVYYESCSWYLYQLSQNVATEETRNSQLLFILSMSLMIL